MLPVDQTLPQNNSQPMFGAVMNSETEEVRRLADDIKDWMNVSLTTKQRR